MGQGWGERSAPGKPLENQSETEGGSTGSVKEVDPDRCCGGEQLRTGRTPSDASVTRMDTSANPAWCSRSPVQCLSALRGCPFRGRRGVCWTLTRAGRGGALLPVEGALARVAHEDHPERFGLARREAAGEAVEETPGAEVGRVGELPFKAKGVGGAAHTRPGEVRVDHLDGARGHTHGAVSRCAVALGRGDGGSHAGEGGLAVDATARRASSGRASTRLCRSVPRGFIPRA
jgi:hypothetical protein